MNKNISYDFSLDSIIVVDAPIGTDPDTLFEQAKQKLIQRIQEDDVTIVFENIFDNSLSNALDKLDSSKDLFNLEDKSSLRKLSDDYRFNQ